MVVFLVVLLVVLQVVLVVISIILVDVVFVVVLFYIIITICPTVEKGQMNRTCPMYAGDGTDTLTETLICQGGWEFDSWQP